MTIDSRLLTKEKPALWHTGYVEMIRTNLSIMFGESVKSNRLLKMIQCAGFFIAPRKAIVLNNADPVMEFQIGISNLQFFIF